MKRPNAPWFKCETNRLFDDDFGNLDDDAKLLLFYLEMLAALTGQDTFPADPRWVFRQIPQLEELPDLEPLAAPRRDGTGWIRWCRADGTAWIDETASQPPGARIEGDPPEHSTAQQSRVEQSRGATLSDSGNGNPARSSCGTAAERESPERGGPPQSQRRAEASPAQGVNMPADVRVIQSSEPLPAPAALPLGPPGADGSGGPGKAGEIERRCAGYRGAEGRRVGECWPKHVAEIVDPLRGEWVTAVFRALNLRSPPDSLEGRRNLGAFAGVYDRLREMRVISDEIQRRILEHDLADARTVGRKRDNPPHRRNAAIFTDIHNNRVQKYLGLGRGPPGER